MTRATRTAWLTLFAVALGLFEAVLVIYLRSLYYPDDPLSLFPLAVLSERDLVLELIREAASVLMLVAVAVLAVSGFLRRFAAFLFLFGLWDIFYYVWLKLLLGWPTRWGEWDVLYLIPWPWFGPWLTPALIALLFAGWGGWMLLSPMERRASGMSMWLFAAGAVLGLAAFLLPGWPLITGGETAVRSFTPTGFPWHLYLPGYLLMAIGLWGAARTAKP